MQFLITGTTALFSGLIYYLLYRTGLAGDLSDPTFGSYPSFSFVLAFSLFGIALSRHAGWRQLLPGVGWLLVTVLCEFWLGTFSSLDLIAALLGYLSAVLAWKLLSNRRAPLKAGMAANVTFALAGIVLLGGSYQYCEGGCYSGRDTPVYMSYAELRSAVNVQSPRVMKSMGSLYLYSDHLFINEKNKGLHIIDNADPGRPQAKAFINIPGNTAVSIRDGFLYADSFVDLVVIDIRDPENIHETARQIDVFPYDAYQAIDDDSVYFWNIDESKGVVIGYE